MEDISKNNRKVSESKIHVCHLVYLDQQMLSNEDIIVHELVLKIIIIIVILLNIPQDPSRVLCGRGCDVRLKGMLVDVYNVIKGYEANNDCIERVTMYVVSRYGRLDRQVN